MEVEAEGEAGAEVEVRVGMAVEVAVSTAAGTVAKVSVAEPSSFHTFHQFQISACLSA